MPMNAVPGFSDKVVDWQRQHGRNHLPWQNTRDPYRVWLSEIMLQQTQVATVLNYYARFLEAFPTVQALAAADEDAVLALWSGLGYYSRARNLHRCARQVVVEHGGVFPPSARQLADLPGIGRSTANAIAAFCYGERVAILDANVRRVLGRVLAFDADLSQAANVQRLWQQADGLLPVRDLPVAMPRYTQGMMDLGARICLPRNPQCLICPVAGACVARQRGNPTAYPVLTRKTRRSSQNWWLLLIQAADRRVWLHKRPAKGIWAGLYAPPVFDGEAQLLEYLSTACLQAGVRHLPAVSHVLTHRDLLLQPVMVQCAEEGEAIGMPDAALLLQPGMWQSLDAAALAQTGLPAPIRSLLERISQADAKP